jgi:hypothetical protein
VSPWRRTRFCLVFRIILCCSVLLRIPFASVCMYDESSPFVAGHKMLSMIYIILSFSEVKPY